MVIFRNYQLTDYDQVAALWTRINRELAPPDMRELFERYITHTLEAELKHALDLFSETKGSVFWVAEDEGSIIGTFGIERRSAVDVELRRMYLDSEFRGQGVAVRMLHCAETKARDLGFRKLVLSTAEIQKAAIRFYYRNNFQLTGKVQANKMTLKEVGGGLTRLYFEKML